MGTNVEPRTPQGDRGARAGWGVVTGPILLALQSPGARWQWARGLVFGAIVLGLAVLGVAAAAGFDGRVVAPRAFIAQSAVLFPVLFLAHGVAVDSLVRRWGTADPAPLSGGP